MSDSFTHLLDCAIQHLQQLKSDGARFVPVSPEVWAALKQPAPRPRRSASPPAPAPAAQPSATKADTRPPASGRFSVPDPAPARIATTVIRPAAEAPPAAQAAPDATVPEPRDQAAAFEQLRQRALACVKCPHLVAARKNVVFGVGDIHARLMFVGEAPGAEEDEQGEPFVGAAGQLLTKIIQTMGLSRQTVYIANILKCRPDTPGRASGNRKPKPEEMATCLPYLQEQIDLIQPQVLVALGATAVEGLLGKTVGITRLRGNWQTYRDTPLMPTFHPAYLLRNQAKSERRKVWEDMLQVMDRLGLPISEKQRGYFQ